MKLLRLKASNAKGSAIQSSFLDSQYSHIMGPGSLLFPQLLVMYHQSKSRPPMKAALFTESDCIYYLDLDYIWTCISIVRYCVVGISVLWLTFYAVPEAKYLTHQVKTAPHRLLPVVKLEAEACCPWKRKTFRRSSYTNILSPCARATCCWPPPTTYQVLSWYHRKWWSFRLCGNGRLKRSKSWGRTCTFGLRFRIPFHQRAVSLGSGESWLASLKRLS